MFNLEKINRQAGSKQEKTGQENIKFYPQKLHFSCLKASFWWTICMLWTVKSMHISSLKQCFWLKNT